jgi:hypothetical protein
VNEPTLAQLTQLLWPNGDHLQSPQVYWLLDGARDPDIAGLVRFGNLEHACLFTGRLHPRLQAAAPYLVHLSAGSPTTNLLLGRGWGKAWGILIVAPPNVTLNQQRLHFKKLLRVQTEDRRELVFRFYDPRVLNLYLPTCTREECRTVFGPVSRFVAEVQMGRAVRVFEFQGDDLRFQEHSLS